MVEPELAFADLNDIAYLASMLKYCIMPLTERADDMAFFQRIDQNVLERLNHVVSNKFVHMDYTDAVRSCSREEV